MIKHLAILLFFIIILTFNPLKGQVYLSEGFEGGKIPSGWTQEAVVANTPWRYIDGGYGPSPAVRYPSHAHTGLYNAIFQVEQVGNKTKLVTKQIDLSAAKKPELKFFYAQEEWGEGDFDKLRLYYKIHKDSTWVLLKEYLQRVPSWTADSMFLPARALTSTFYLAFEAESNWGFGACIDDIAIIERGVIPMQVKSFSIQQPNTDICATRSDNNIMLRFDFNIYGNTGKIILDSLSFKSLNQSNADIKSNGVKLYKTSSVTFDPKNKIGTSQNIGNKVTFKNLNFEFPFVGMK